ncbi:hypothetical protein EV363DRAFT_1454515 [Boletus edulis]|uniref:Uncharacterized protein n=1 Tax=Boletus edulis BED1 TaxID=1328754 RepID=A0AAD4BAE9_BOLED|nr:hypothetical protein EV363DRAFT_1178072 [Boletus edulis]KAF8124470.1 hypothetical protein EV363DRAFT_1454512 [Boletus edulis]KAF8124471.1 hypothetical protein EV363DRAFT_1454514 [Boletus edulis]KAF8124472.1 hypothetical protein EV363DRAFT_1454515 [Boletus edulis]KAF8415661.1 hypothetical protein L210DRAFT_3657179 [Boletus edulis BED1]
MGGILDSVPSVLSRLVVHIVVLGLVYIPSLMVMVRFLDLVSLESDQALLFEGRA